MLTNAANAKSRKRELSVFPCITDPMISEIPICLEFVCLPLTPDPRNVALRRHKSPFKICITSLQAARTRPVFSVRSSSRTLRDSPMCLDARLKVMDALLKDLKHSAYMLLQTPGFN